MLTELKLSNFRIFGDEVTVRFRPITVLIGRNSSGKSSVVKFLLMLQQSIGPGRPQFLSPEGDKVQLGIFSALKNSLTKKRNLAFELTATSPVPHPGSRMLGRLDLFGDIEPSNRQYKATVTFSYSSKANIGRVKYSLVDASTGKEFTKDPSSITEDSIFLGDRQTYRK